MSIHYTLRFDYTNEGGLPAGGTVVVIDLEDEDSLVVLSGLVGGTPVAVNWQVSFLEVSGGNAAFPTWNPATATLSGNAEGSWQHTKSRVLRVRPCASRG